MNVWESIRGAFRLKRSNISLDQLDFLIDIGHSNGSPVGIEPSSSGKWISEEVALAYDTVFACVSLLSEDGASIPLQLMRRQDEQSRTLVQDHPLSKILRKPNEYMDGMEYRRLAWAHWLVYGNHFALIERSPDRNRSISALLPIHPRDMFVGWAKDGRSREYKHTNPKTGKITTLKSRDVFHWRNLGDSGLIGWSPLRRGLKETLGTAISAQEYGASYFKNGARASLWFKPSGNMSPEKVDEFLKWARENYTGANAHRPGVLRANWEVTEAGKVGIEDTQLIPLHKLSAERIAAIYRVGPAKIQNLDRAIQSNITEQSIAHVRDAIRPKAESLEAAMASQLLTDRERGGGLHLYHDYIDLLKGTPKEQAEYIKGLVGMKVLTPNEARQWLGYAPQPDGNELLQPVNLTTTKQLKEASDAQKKAAEAAAKQSEETPDDDAEEDA